MGDRKTRSGPSVDAPLFDAIDGALRPAGILTDLSRIIAQLARSPVRWAVNESFDLRDADAEGCTAKLKDSVRSGWKWLASDVPIGRFAAPSLSPSGGSAKDVSALHVWAVRVDSAACHLYIGIARPSAASAHDLYDDADTHYICTGSSLAYHKADGKELNMPFSHGGDAAGSLYHFTADLSTGTLRVRPIVKLIDPRHQPHDPPQTEWTVAEGLSDLAERSAVVFVYADWGAASFSLLSA
jgi:hypothetical protein